MLGWTATFAVAIASYGLSERRALGLRARFQPGMAASPAMPRSPWTRMRRAV